MEPKVGSAADSLADKSIVGMTMAKKVLIVEDNELNMKLFHDLLDAQGYETLPTSFSWTSSCRRFPGWRSPSG